MGFKGFSQKIRSNRAFYTQILVVALAFAAMTGLSYAFMSGIVRGNLVRNANSVLDVSATRISTHLDKFYSAIESFSEETRGMVMQGAGTGELQAYIDDISRFAFLDGSASSGIQSFYGYFETLPGGPALIADTNGTLPEREDPEQSDWYRLAAESGGGVVETTPYISGANEMVYTYAKCISDGEGRILGVVGMDVKLDTVGQEVVRTALDLGGYGMLMNQDLMTMFHPNPEFLGVYADDPSISIRVFAEELRRGEDVLEHPIVSYRNEKSLAFFRKLPNGWYLGLITPERQYYASVTTMAVTVSALGVTLAVVLIGILARVDKARSKSDDANKKKSMFLANMSHEIRTPLNAVIGLSELALDSGRIEAGTEDKLEKIHASGMIILSIVNDILDISKLESGKYELFPTRYDTPSLINDVVTFNIVRIGEKPVIFRMDVDENLPGTLYGDDLRVKQIFNNLLSNAFKYTDSGTVIWSVSFERDGQDVWLVSSVRDTGIGMKPDDVKKLFSDYNQVDASANRKTAGTGLGLAIAKRFAGLMDGTIEVESEYGSGTAFHVRLRQGFVDAAPIGAEVAGNLTEMRYTLSKRARNKKLRHIDLSYAHVLVVDDTETNLDVVTGMLKPYRIQIDCASGGQQAVEMIRKGRPRYSAVFMDHMMPGMDGMEAARMIREEVGTDYARSVPIIALTANAIVGNEEMFLANGFQDFIPKPIDIAKLDASLRRWVRNKEFERAPQTAEESGDQDRNPGASRFDGIVIEGVEIERALERFGGDESVLTDVLRSYAVNTRPILTALRVYLKTGRLADYAIAVHGIKGSSYGIFAEQAGKAAETLETVSREGDMDAVLALHPVFERTAGELLDQVDRALEQLDAVSDKPTAAEPSPALLLELREAAKAFDMDRVDAAMARLELCRYERGGHLVAWLREQVNDMMFEVIADGKWFGQPEKP